MIQCSSKQPSVSLLWLLFLRQKEIHQLWIYTKSYRTRPCCSCRTRRTWSRHCSGTWSPSNPSRIFSNYSSEPVASFECDRTEIIRKYVCMCDDLRMDVWWFKDAFCRHIFTTLSRNSVWVRSLLNWMISSLVFSGQSGAIKSDLICRFKSSDPSSSTNSDTICRFCALRLWDLQILYFIISSECRLTLFASLLCSCARVSRASAMTLLCSRSMASNIRADADGWPSSMSEMVIWSKWKALWLWTYCLHLPSGVVSNSTVPFSTTRSDVRVEMPIIRMFGWGRFPRKKEKKTLSWMYNMHYKRIFVRIKIHFSDKYLEKYVSYLLDDVHVISLSNQFIIVMQFHCDYPYFFSIT